MPGHRISNNTQYGKKVPRGPVTVKTVSVPDEVSRQNKMLALKLVPYIALDYLTQHKGTDIDWRNLQFRLYVGEQLVQLCMQNYDGLPESVLTDMQEAIMVLHAIADKYPKGIVNNMRCSVIEAGILCVALDHTDEMQESVDTHIQLAVYRHVSKMIV